MKNYAAGDKREQKRAKKLKKTNERVMGVERVGL